MTYGDIARAVTKTLKELFPEADIVSMARTEDISRPAFFFYLKPVAIEAASERARHNVLSLYIDYLQKVKDEPDMYDVATKIRDALGWSYRVGDNYIDVTGFDWEFVGQKRDTLELDITLEYFDALDADEDAEPMEEIGIAMELEEVVGRQFL